MLSDNEKEAVRAFAGKSSQILALMLTDARLAFVSSATALLRVETFNDLLPQVREYLKGTGCPLCGEKEIGYGAHMCKPYSGEHKGSCAYWDDQSAGACDCR